MLENFITKTSEQEQRGLDVGLKMKIVSVSCSIFPSFQCFIQSSPRAPRCQRNIKQTMREGLLNYVKLLRRHFTFTPARL